MAAASAESANPAEFHSISAPADTHVYKNIVEYVASIYAYALYIWFKRKSKYYIVLSTYITILCSDNKSELAVYYKLYCTHIRSASGESYDDVNVRARV